jgi:quercetin dioxygenase-like cupin family protein
LRDEIESLRADLRRTSGGRAAKTLAKSEELRVTLIVLKDGTVLDPQATAGGASLEVLDGRVRVQADGEALEVTQGDLVVLSANLREPITALSDAALLVTVAWPPGAGAWEQEERSGHL